MFSLSLSPPFLHSAVPPVFQLPLNRSVPENSVIDTLVGTPLIASTNASNVAVTYQLGTGNGTSVFKIGFCDGQLRVLASYSLDYEQANVYCMAVSALADNQVTAMTTVDVCVNVVDVNEPPYIYGPLDRYVYENQTAGPGYPIDGPVTGTRMQSAPGTLSSSGFS